MICRQGEGGIKTQTISRRHLYMPPRRRRRRGLSKTGRSRSGGGGGGEWAAASSALPGEPELFGGQLRFQSGAVNNNNKK